MRARSGLYRRQNGEERLWYQPADINRMMEDALLKQNHFPLEERPAVDIEKFIQSLDVRMDQYAELEPDILGLTEFYKGAPPKIFINRDLTGAIDDDETPLGIRGRWRATMAHEASHVLMHRILFELNEGQTALFASETNAQPERLMRCLKKNVLFRGRGSDWREVQANMGMAALLMPESLFRKVAAQAASRLQLPSGLTTGSPAAARITTELAALFDVSKQAAGIRLETTGFLSKAQQPWLISAEEN